MAFTTFVYDTLDVCTRLGRYVVQELTGWHGKFGRFFATGRHRGVPLYFLLSEPIDETGKVVPVWRVFWGCSARATASGGLNADRRDRVAVADASSELGLVRHGLPAASCT